MPRYAVAAEQGRAGPRRPVPPWHAADLLDEDPELHVGETVVSLCGVAGLRVIPLDWVGVAAGHGCAACAERVARAGSLPGWSWCGCADRPQPATWAVTLRVVDRRSLRPGGPARAGQPTRTT